MSSYDVRRYSAEDEPAVLDLLRRSLGWQRQEPNTELFLWKHRASPFGSSPAWVAEDAGQVIGFRTFMRWEFARDGHVVRAVRAVDTATDPRHQGRGIFRALTIHALDELKAEGTSFVFNTPNDQSRPGYLKMGWQIVGRLPVSVRPRTVSALRKMVSARAPADRWSKPEDSGRAAAEAFADPGLKALLGRAGTPVGLETRRTTDFLRWRYGLNELHYRVLMRGGRIEDGLMVFRVRGRGPAREAAVCDVILPSGVHGGGLAARVLRGASADYALALGRVRGLAPLPGQGPLLTCLALGDDPAPWTDLRLTLGDVELF